MALIANVRRMFLAQNQIFNWTRSETQSFERVTTIDRRTPDGLLDIPVCFMTEHGVIAIRRGYDAKLFPWSAITDMDIDHIDPRFTNNVDLTKEISASAPISGQNFSDPKMLTGPRTDVAGASTSVPQPATPAIDKADRVIAAASAKNK